jgi:hypothetical protein
MWSVTWGEVGEGEHKLQVFGKEILWEIFGPKDNDISEQLRNGELCDLCRSYIEHTVRQYKMLRWVWSCRLEGETRNAYKMLVGETFWKMSVWKI